MTIAEQSPQQPDQTTGEVTRGSTAATTSEIVANTQPTQISDTEAPVAIATTTRGFQRTADFETNQHKGFLDSTRNRVIAFGGAVVATAAVTGTIFGILGSKQDTSEQTSSQQPIATASSAPSTPATETKPSSAPTPTTATPVVPTQAETTAPSPGETIPTALIDAARGLDPAKFLQQPADVRRATVYDFYKGLYNSGNLAIEMNMALPDGSKVYQHNPADPKYAAKETDSPQQILSAELFALSAARATTVHLEDNSPTAPFDKANAKKNLSGPFYDNASDTAFLYKAWSGNFDNYPTTGPLADLSWTVDAARTDPNIHQGRDLAGNTIRFKDILVSEMNGTQQYTERYVLAEFPTPDGMAKLWQLISRDRA